MKKLNTAAVGAVLMTSVSLPTLAAAEDLTLCWAAWDPANALVELSKEFEAQSGHTMNFEFVPWPNFADRMLNELNSGGKLCDLLIGDSQWIGGGAENGHYVKLNDFFDAEGISMDDFAPATVYAYSTWPKGTPNYYALPAMGDANGWFYRADWFADPDIQAAYKEATGEDLREPQSQKELLQGDSLDAAKSGQVAMAMNWFAFFPGLYADPATGGDKIDFFVNPPQNQAGSTLGGQGISVVSYSDKQDAALEYIKWFANPEVQAKWWELGGYSAHNSVLNDPGFVDSQPFAGDFLEAMNDVQDFWQEPAYAELLLAMQKRVHDYVVADQGTAKEALDKLIEDWTETFEDEGKL